MSDSTMTTLRLPKELVKRADELVEAMQDSEQALYGRMSRSVILRMAIARGLEVLETESSPKKRGRAR